MCFKAAARGDTLLLFGHGFIVSPKEIFPEQASQRDSLIEVPFNQQGGKAVEEDS